MLANNPVNIERKTSTTFIGAVTDAVLDVGSTCYTRSVLSGHAEVMQYFKVAATRICRGAG